MRETVTKSKRIVIKIGSSLLVDEQGPRSETFKGLALQINALLEKGLED